MEPAEDGEYAGGVRARPVVEGERHLVSGLRSTEDGQPETRQTRDRVLLLLHERDRSRAAGFLHSRGGRAARRYPVGRASVEDTDDRHRARCRDDHREDDEPSARSSASASVLDRDQDGPGGKALSAAVQRHESSDGGTPDRPVRVRVPDFAVSWPPPMIAA
jgi:hypothetical protein